MNYCCCALRLWAEVASAAFFIAKGKQLQNLTKAEVDHAIELKSHGGDRRSEQAQQDQGVNHNLVKGTGNAEYIKARARKRKVLE